MRVAVAGEFPDPQVINAIATPTEVMGQGLNGPLLVSVVDESWRRSNKYAWLILTKKSHVFRCVGNSTFLLTIAAALRSTFCFCSWQRIAIREVVCDCDPGQMHLYEHKKST